MILGLLLFFGVGFLVVWGASEFIKKVFLPDTDTAVIGTVILIVFGIFGGYVWPILNQ